MFFLKNLIYLFFFLILSSHSFSSNDDPIFYEEVDGWEVGILPNLNYGCYTSSPIYQDGEMISVYVDNRENVQNVYLHLVNPLWSSLKIGDMHEMGIIFEPFSDKWIGDAQVVSYGDHKGIQFIVGAEFVATFAQMESIRFTYNDRNLLGLVLTTRFMLSMLRTIGLNDSDIVMLKQYHLENLKFHLYLH